MEEYVDTKRFPRVIYDNKVVKLPKNVKQFPNAVGTIKFIDKNWKIDDACFDIIHPHPKLGVGIIVPPKTESCCIRSGVTVDLTGSIVLSPEVLIQEGTQIFTHTHSWKHSRGRRKKVSQTWVRDLIIKRDVFIGVNCLIIGVKSIGRGAVIGAGAVVLTDVPQGKSVFGVWH